MFTCQSRSPSGITTGCDSKCVAGETPVGKRRRQHERLERRARLALALDGEVELALAVVRAADHREHRARVVVDRHERRLRAFGILEHLRDRGAGQLLEAEVERRVDAQPAAEHAAGAVLVDELLLHVVDEVLALPLLCAGQVDLVGMWAAPRSGPSGTRPGRSGPGRASGRGRAGAAPAPPWGS